MTEQSVSVQPRQSEAAISHITMSDVSWDGNTCILLPVANPARAAGMARVAARLASSCQTQVVVLHLLPPGTQSEAALEPPVDHDSFPAVEKAMTVLREAGVKAISIVAIAEGDEGEAIRHVAGKLHAQLTLLGWRSKTQPDGTVLNAALAGVLTDPISDIAMLGGPAPKAFQRILVPLGSGPHSALALRLAMQLVAPVDDEKPGSVTALHIEADGTVSLADMRRVQSYIADFADNPQLVTRVITGNDVAEGILGELAAGYDLVVMGTSQEALIDRLLFGEVPQQVAEGSRRTPVMVVRRHSEPVTRAVRGAWHGLRDVVARLSDEERTAVRAVIQRGAHPGLDFFVMIGLSSVLATLGLFLNSPAVIIGAMLVAPLMSAIVGIGLGIVEGDGQLLRAATQASILGMALGVLVGLATTVLLPGVSATPEIMARTAPGVLDLGVALVSGAAVAYALCRKDLSAALAGVAIAAALVPPLATIGIGLGLSDARIAGGALLLFVTNLIAIAGSSGLVFLLMGFQPPAGEKQRRLLLRQGAIGTIALLGLVTMILIVLTARTLQEGRLDGQIHRAVVQEIHNYPNTELDGLSYTVNGDGTLKLDVAVRSSHRFTRDEVVALQAGIAEDLNRPVALLLTVIPATRLDPLAPPEDASDQGTSSRVEPGLKPSLLGGFGESPQWM